jgi:predicted MFS family arabinose efflux permease
MVAALYLIRSSELERGSPVSRGRGQIKDGLRYAWSRPALRLPLLLTLVVGTWGFNFSVLLPLMARFVFNGNASTFGAMLSMMGVGSLVGALAAAGRARPTHRLLLVAAFGFGILLIGAAIMPTLLLEMAILVPLGVSLMTFQATANSLLQLNSDPTFRGRVMALFMIVFVGSTPIGAPTVGWIAQQFGPRAGLGVGGLAILVGSTVAAIALRRLNL